MSMSLPRLARRRLLRQRGVAAALAAGLAASLGLTATVLVAQVMAAESGLHRILTGTSGVVSIQSSGARTLEQFDAFQADARNRVGGSGARLRAVGAYAVLGASNTWTQNGARFAWQPSFADPNPPRPSLAYSEDLAAHVRVLSGQLPADVATTGDHPVTLSSDQPFGLKVGDRICLGFVGGPGDPARAGVFPVCLRVAAIWQALDPRGAYWAGRFVPRELLVSRADLYDGLGTLNRANDITLTGVTAGSLFQAGVGSIDATDAAGVAQRLRELHGYYSVRTDAFFATDVDGAIDGFLERQRLAGYTVQLVAAALVLVALFAVSFVARHFLDAQTTELAALRARGWARGRVLTFLLLQLGGLLLLALPLAAGLAILAALALGRLAFPTPPPLAPADLAGIVPPLAGAAAAALLLLVALAADAARRDVLELRRADSRPAAQAWWQHRGADLALAVVAVPLLAESRLLGSGQVRAAGAADDPLGLLLPGVALGLLAVAGLRLLPVVARAALRLAGDVPGSLARWQLARRPAQHASLALLATFAVAVGIFSSIYATTDRRNALDRAAYQAGADVRVTYGPPGPRVDLLAKRLPGAAATSRALRLEASPGSVGSAGATALGVDTTALPDVAWTRPGLTGPPLADLTRQLAARSPDGLDLPGRPRTLSLWTSYDGTEGDIAADVTDAAGHAGTLDLGPPGSGAWRRLEAPLRFPGEPEPVYPVRLDRLVVRGPAHGNLALSDLSADDRVVERFASPNGWWALEPGVIATGPKDLAPATRNGRPGMAVDVQLPDGELDVRPAATADPLPAVVSGGLLRSLGIGLEQPFPLRFDTGPVQVTAVRAVDDFPTLYPDDRFIVLPLDPLLARLATASVGPTVPNELWARLRGAPGPAARAMATANTLPPQELDVREDLQSAALSDPLRTALDGTLTIGFVATLGVAVLAFGIHFLAAARARMHEYAILRANGLAPGHVRRSLLLEQAVLLAHGVLVGGVLGLVIAYVVLPAVQLGDGPTDLVPPTVVTPDPAVMLAAALALVGGGLLGGWLARRAATRQDVRAQLRELG